MMLRRETIIALRARHTAFRMAMDILYPQRPLPGPSASDPPPSADAVPAIDVLAQFTAWEWQERQERRRRTMLWLVMLLWAAAIALGAWNWPRRASRPSPPVPPARPILPAVTNP